MNGKGMKRGIMVPILTLKNELHNVDNLNIDKLITTVSVKLTPLNGTADTKSANWNYNSNNSVTVSFNGLQTETLYQIKIDIATSTNNVNMTVDDIERIIYISTTFSCSSSDGTNPSRIFENNPVRFTKEGNEHNGVTISGSHTFVEYVGTGGNPPKGSIAISADGDSNAFVGDGPGGSTVTIKSDGSKSFKFYIHTGNTNSNKILNDKVGFKVTINGKTLPESQYLNTNVYIGLKDGVAGYDTSMNSVGWFSGEITITIDGKQQASADKFELQLFIIFNEETTTSQSNIDQGTTTLSMISREKETTF